MNWGTLLLLAGPNGAGKTSVVRQLSRESRLQELVLLNADERTLAKLKAAGFPGFAATPLELLMQYFVEAANEVLAEAVSLLRDGRNVCLETVLSTGKYRQMVQQVQEGGGRFELVYVALNHWSISKERVRLRFAKGGHDVPAEKLEERWKRSLQHFGWFAAKADRLAVFDNSSFDPCVNPVLLAIGEAGKLQWRVDRSQVFLEMRAALEEASKDSP